MRAFLRDNGLTIALLLLFVSSVTGHFLTGHAFHNQELADHGRAPIGLLAYLREDQFWSTVFENWESEFLQMSTYVVLTAYLFQRGSAESQDPDSPPRNERMAAGDVTKGSPSALRAGAAMRWIYSHSLGLALFILFVVTFIAHWAYSAREAAAEARLHGEPAIEAVDYLFFAQFWFESFQNWQSEFLSTAVLIILSIYLRETGSPESKSVGAPHSETGT